MKNYIFIYCEDESNNNFKKISKTINSKQSECKLVTFCLQKEFPKSIKEAYEKGNRKLVCEYVALTNLFEFGGILATDGFVFGKDLSPLYEKYCFFSEPISETSSDFIMGAKKGCLIVKELLDTYLEDSVYKNQNISLNERVKDILKYRYGYKPSAEHQKIEDCIDIYSYKELYLSSDENMLFRSEYNKECMKQIILDLQEKLEILEKTIEENGKLREQVNALSNELQGIKGSRSYRLTKPLRKMKNFAKRIKNKLVRRK